MALDFLARTFSLDQLPKLLRLGLAALRKPVDKGIDWVINGIIKLAKKAWQGIKAGGQAVAQAGRDAVDTVQDFFGVRTKLNAGPTERHELYFREKNGEVTLIIESTPTDIRKFLKEYVSFAAINMADTTDPKAKLVRSIGTHLATYTPLYEQLGRTQNKAAKKQVQQKLLQKNLELTPLLQELLAEDRDVGQYINIYRLEGLTGTWASMPQPFGDVLSPDHQPQASILEWAAIQLEVPDEQDQTKLVRLFSNTSAMAKRGKSRATNGYAINLFELRHSLGRTYKNKGEATATAFRQLIRRLIKSAPNHQAMRDLLVEELKKELQADVSAMFLVLKRADAWADIEAILPQHMSVAKKKALRERITKQIENGERQILNQPMDELKNP